MDPSNATGAACWDPDLTAQQFGTSVKQLGKTEPGWITIINKLLSLVGVIRAVWLGFLKSHMIYA